MGHLMLDFVASRVAGLRDAGERRVRLTRQRCSSQVSGAVVRQRCRPSRSLADGEWRPYRPCRFVVNR